jgi:hypothetical protein
MSAAFIARCIGIEEVYSISIHTDPETGAQSFPLLAFAYIDFEVEFTISLHPDIQEPELFYVTMFIQDKSGGYFFREGERYFISGEYSPETRKAFSAGTTETMPMISFGLDPLTFGNDALREGTISGSISSFSELHPNARIAMRRLFPSLSADDFPIDVIAWRPVVEPDDLWFSLGLSSLDEAVRSPVGPNIESAVGIIERNTNRLNIITTGNLDSIFHFNQNKANIDSGRTFSNEEYENGARVCLIPQALANRNNLHVGDNVRLVIFEGQYNSHSIIFAGNPNRSMRAWLPGGFEPGMMQEEPIDFQVVGIYRSPAPQHDDPQSIPFNTIFIPDNSFGGFDCENTNTSPWKDDRAESPLLNTIVIPNGRNDEFRESVNALLPGYGNFFKIYDQGYSVVKATLDNLLQSGAMIFVLCAAGWLISATVFCLFFVLRKKKEAGLLYALGFSRKSRFRWVFVQCLIVIVIAQALAFGASSALYGRILGYAVETAMLETAPREQAFTNAAVAVDGATTDMSVLRNPLAVPLGVAVGLAALLLASAVISKSISKSGARLLRGGDG